MKNLRFNLRRFLKSNDGNFLITAAIMLPVLLGVIGLGLDFAIFTSQKSRMQETADAAAIAAVREAAIQGWNQDTAEAIVDQVVAESLAKSAYSSVTYLSTTSVDAKNNSVKVELRQDGHGYILLGMFASNPQIGIVTEAKLAATTNICVLTLDPSASRSLQLTKPSIMTANGCGVFANSTDPKAVSVETNALLQSLVTCSSGGWEGRALDYKPEPVTDCPALDDPLLQRAAPTFGGCDYIDIELHSSLTLSPGVYCGGLSAADSAVLSLEPGVYVIKDGPLQLSGNASLVGTNIGFYLTGNDATFRFDGSSNVALTAPKTGPLAGILFFEDRNMAKGRSFEISSKDARKLVGTIYLPNGNLHIKGKGKVAEDSEWTAIIANEILVDKGPTVTLNSDYGGSDIPVPAGIAGTTGTAFLTR